MRLTWDTGPRLMSLSQILSQGTQLNRTIAKARMSHSEDPCVNIKMLHQHRKMIDLVLSLTMTGKNPPAERHPTHSFVRAAEIRSAGILCALCFLP